MPKGMCGALGLASAIVATLVTHRADAGELARIEQSHAASSSSSSSSSSRSHSRSSSSAGRVASTLFDVLVTAVGLASSGSSDSSASGSGESDESGRYANGGYALTQVAAEPYAAKGSIYITHEADRASRWGEVFAAGGAGLSKNVYSFDFAGTANLGVFTLRGSWQRFHEVGAFDVDRLDFVRGQVGVNVLSGWGERMELHLLAGGTGMVGTRWTPALDAEVDARIFPIRPFSLRASIGASFFEHGDPFVRARIAPGITIGRVDVGIGLSWMHQAGTFDMVSPGVWLALRL